MSAATDAGNYLGSGSGNDSSLQISRDGRVIAYNSYASNIVVSQSDGVNTSDVFVFDRSTNQSTLVSHSAGTPNKTGNTESVQPALSGDGRFVLFLSYATDLIPGFIDGNGASNPDIYLFDRASGTTTLVSHRFDSLITGGNNKSGDPSQLAQNFSYALSDDGHYAVYISLATDLFTSAIGPIGYQAIGYDRITGASKLLTRRAGTSTVFSDGSAFQVRISGNGNIVAITSTAIDIVTPGAISSFASFIYQYDLVNDTIQLVTHSPGNPGQPVAGCSRPSLSADGRYMVFSGGAASLVTGVAQVPSRNRDVILYDRILDDYVLVSHAYADPLTVSNFESHSAFISRDGNWIVFNSASLDIVPNYTQGTLPQGKLTDNYATYLYSRSSGTNELVSHQSNSPSANGKGNNTHAALSDDGRYVVFSSTSTDLVEAKTTVYGLYTTDLFVFDRATKIVKLASSSIISANQYGNGASQCVSISGDGRVVYFSSTADNLTPNDRNGSSDTFVYVQTPPIAKQLKINDGSVQRSSVRTLTVSFDDIVSLPSNPASAFILTRNDQPAMPLTLAVSVQNTTVTTVVMTWSGLLTQVGSLSDGDYTLRIVASSVVGFANLDGNGDGAAGDDYVSPAGAIFRFFGDADGDRSVGQADFTAFRLAFGAANAWWFNADGDGDVDNYDFMQFRTRFGTMLP